MINLPMSLTAAQSDKLQALVVKGGDDFLLVDDTVNGAPLLLVVARGVARDYVRDRLYGAKGEAAEGDAAEPEAEPKPVKVVPVREGVADNVPPSAGGLRAN
jgi:hypothetical protein